MSQLSEIATDLGLKTIAPDLHALIKYLTRENNGIPVYEQSEFSHPRTGRRIYAMSNGYTYSHDFWGRWYSL